MPHSGPLPGSALSFSLSPLLVLPRMIFTQILVSMSASGEAQPKTDDCFFKIRMKPTSVEGKEQVPWCGTGDQSLSGQLSLCGRRSYQLEGVAFLMAQACTNPTVHCSGVRTGLDEQPAGQGNMMAVEPPCPGHGGSLRRARMEEKQQAQHEEQ